MTSESSESSILRRPHLLAFIYTIIIALIGIGGLKLKYTAGDDLVMQLLLNGNFTNGALNIYSVFNNIVFSGIVGHLYYYFPNVEWYPVALLSLVLISIYVISYLLIKHQPHIRGYALLVILTASVWFLANFQFTVVTGISTLAGYFLLANANDNKIRIVLSISLLFVASTVRFDMFALVSLCIVPHLLMDNFSIKRLYPFGVLLILIGGSLYLHHYYYHIGDWGYFTQFNALRGSLNDNPNLEPEIVGQYMNTEGIKLFKLFIYPESLDLPTMEKVLQHAKGSLWDNFHFTKVLYKYRLMLLLSLLLFICNIISKKYYLALFPIIFWGIVYYITVNHSAKERIVYPTMFAYTIFSLYYIRLKYKAFYGLFVVYVIYKHIGLYPYHNVIPINEQVYKELNQNKNIVYVPLPHTSNVIFSMEPFAQRPSNNIILSGWTTNLPLLKNRTDIQYSQNIMNIKANEGKSIVYIAKQYPDLESLYELYGEDAFVVIKIIGDFYFFVKK